MFFSNFNKLGIMAADVTSEAGAKVKTTQHTGLIMWSENGRTYIARASDYIQANGGFYGSYGLEGDWIPYCWDDNLRKMLKV